VFDRNKILQLIGVDVWRLRMQKKPLLNDKSKDSWVTLQNEVKSCEQCSLHKTRTQTVFGVGDSKADWLFIGEAPGMDEDLQGEPFVGRAGGLLNEMFFSIGLSREEIFIANILKCRPPQNRDPLASEVAQCLPYLERQIQHINPMIIIAVGRVAAQNLLQTDKTMSQLRGRIHSFGAKKTPLVVIYHPAYLLRSPSQKFKAWEDLTLAKQAISKF
jgi:DNA polymerase